MDWAEPRILSGIKVAHINGLGKWKHEGRCDAAGSNARCYLMQKMDYKKTDGDPFMEDPDIPTFVVLKVAPKNETTNIAYRDLTLLTHSTKKVFKKYFPQLVEGMLEIQVEHALDQLGLVYWFETFCGISIHVMTTDFPDQLSDNFKLIVDGIKKMREELLEEKIWVDDFHLGNICFDAETMNVMLVDPRLISTFCPGKLDPQIDQINPALSRLVSKMSQPSLSQEIVSECFKGDYAVEMDSQVMPGNSGSVTPVKKKSPKKRKAPPAPKPEKKKKPSDESDEETDQEVIPVIEALKAMSTTPQDMSLARQEVLPVRRSLDPQMQVIPLTTKPAEKPTPRTEPKYTLEQIKWIFYEDPSRKCKKNAGCIRYCNDLPGQLTDFSPVILGFLAEPSLERLDSIGIQFVDFMSGLKELVAFSKCIDALMFALIDLTWEDDLKEKGFAYWWNQRQIRDDDYVASKHGNIRNSYIRQGKLMMWLNTDIEGKFESIKNYFDLPMNLASDIWSSILFWQGSSQVIDPFTLTIGSVDYFK